MALIYNTFDVIRGLKHAFTLNWYLIEIMLTMQYRLVYYDVGWMCVSQIQPGLQNTVKIVGNDASTGQPTKLKHVAI